MSAMISLLLQAIVYEGQDKNPEMCRVLLTHEIDHVQVTTHLSPVYRRCTVQYTHLYDLFI